MSLKPPKKSDLDKGWMKARRDKPKKIQPEYHLIVTEGTDTEPAYFGAMKDIINSAYPDRIQLSIHGAGDNTLNLFQKARQLASTSANGYKHFGSFMIPMTSRLITSTKRPNFVYRNLRRKPPIMPYGQTSALNYGSFSISVSCSPICTEVPTGRN